MLDSMLVSCREVLPLYSKRSAARVLRVVLVDETGSTMDLALEFKHCTPTAVYALAQTRGRGRTGPWLSPRGGLWLTVGVRRDHAAPPTTLPVSVALVAASALREELGLEVEVVWPNDLVVGGRKLGGVLVEGHGDVLLVGLGVNVNNEPPVPGSTSIAEQLGSRVDVHELALQIAGLLLEATSLETLPKCLLEALDATRGRRVVVQGVSGVVAGTSLGVDEEGRLVVESGSGVVRLDCCGLLGMEGLEYKPLPF